MPLVAAALRVCALVWLLAVAWGVGRLLLRPLAIGPRHPAEEVLFSLGLGLGAMSLLVLGLGVAGGYNPPALGALLAALTAAALPALLRDRPAPGGARLVPAALKPAVALLGAAALISGLVASSPTAFYDALVYHLGVPNLWLLRGRIEPLPHVVYSNFPLGTEMLFLLGLFLGGPELAGLIGWAFTALAALAAGALVLPRWGIRPAVLAAGFFFLSPQVLLLSRYVTVDAAMAFYVLLAFLCLLNWRDTERPPLLVLAGIFGGLAFSTKYLGGLLAILLPAGVLLARRQFRGLLALLLPAAIVASPWLLKNLLFTGNPVYPVLPGVFGWGGWSPERAAAFEADAHAAWVIARSWGDWLRLPADLVLGRRDFGAPDVGGWVWVPVIAAAAFVATRRGRGADRLVLALFAASLLVWAATFWMARFLLPALALGSVLVALALERLGSRWHPRWPAIAIAALSLGTAVTVAADPLARRALVHALAPALGLQTRDAYLGSLIRIHPAVLEINRRLPPDARVLVLGDAKTAYLRRDHLAATVLDRPLLPDLLGDRREPEAVDAALRSAGVTHVLLNTVELERTQSQYPLSSTPLEVLQAFRGFLRARGQLLFSGNGVLLFEIPGQPAARAPDA